MHLGKKREDLPRSILKTGKVFPNLGKKPSID